MELNPKAKALAAARKRITELQQQMTDKALKMAAEVEKLLEVATVREAKGFLKVHCGLSSSDLGTYVKFSKTLKGAEDVLARSRIPFSVMKALASADSDTRTEALTTIAGGAHLDTSEIAAIRRRNRTDKMSRAQAAEKDRAAVIAAELRRRAASSSTALDQETDAFLDTVRAFESRFRYFIQSFADAKKEEPETAEEFMADFERIRSAGEHLLETFVEVFGPRHDLAEDLKLSRARYALQRFAEGRFAHDGGWTFEEGIPDPRNLDIIGALLILTSRPRNSLWLRTPKSPRPTDLT
ncbi:MULTISPECIES: hypothetical protein [unclassified Rhizobium]|uniref:hypothetical protein n=1 Tax=unclassified Rhizobium TaxID=2613769 RepID=UPI001042D8C7|nr:MULTISPECIES: hypothetical protein [unclassified Rhizobium]MBB4171946.1 inorganic triphosphatase YgiF [Rhizobium sp. BK538]TCM63359.1 hypothetical protein EV291_14917 [Rhizobium sp. BK068]